MSREVKHGDVLLVRYWNGTELRLTISLADQDSINIPATRQALIALWTSMWLAFYEIESES